MVQAQILANPLNGEFPGQIGHPHLVPQDGGRDGDGPHLGLHGQFLAQKVEACGIGQGRVIGTAQHLFGIGRTRFPHQGEAGIGAANVGDQEGGVAVGHDLRSVEGG